MYRPYLCVEQELTEFFKLLLKRKEKVMILWIFFPINFTKTNKQQQQKHLLLHLRHQRYKPLIRHGNMS